MTTEENNLLRELLEKKIAEYDHAMNFISEMFDKEDAKEESQHIWVARNQANAILFHLREGSYVEHTINHIKEMEQ